MLQDGKTGWEKTREVFLKNSEGHESPVQFHGSTFKPTNSLTLALAFLQSKLYNQKRS